LDLGIGALGPKGRLGFLCTDRWKFMSFAERFRKERLPEVDIVLDKKLDAADAYAKRVDVYPSLLVVQRKRKISRPVTSSTRKKTLVEAGYEIRVGPALGITEAFVLSPDERGVEERLLHPWFDSTEIFDGSLKWRGRRVIALYDDNGQLLDLRRFPLARRRLRAYRDRLSARAVVRAGAVWYRPIDKVVPSLWRRPKLIVPGIAKIPRIAFDHSGAVPSHGAYAIFGSSESLSALYEKLRGDGLANAIEGIAPRIKGGYVRCYGAVLRQIAV
jgi:hypothetical protein